MVSKRAATLILVCTTLAAWSPDTYAQKMPWTVLPLAASPIIALLLSLVLGAVANENAQ